MEVEGTLIVGFHQARRKQLSEAAIAAMIKLRAGGLFDGYARCKNLWDEVCWALQESQDEVAVEAAEMTIWQFCSAEISGMLPEEMRLHCYLVTDDAGDDGLPWANEDAVRRDVERAVCEKACHRNLSDLEMG